jgi:hypothetical protein
MKKTTMMKIVASQVSEMSFMVLAPFNF